VSGAKVSRIGTVIGDRFRLDEQIGRGAMAEVYRALDLETQAFVALKILRPQHVTDSTSLKRFAREADVQARLRHRNVAALLATGVTKEQYEPYLAVELLRGRSLRSVIKGEGKVTPRRAASYAWQALQGLHAVHQAGVLHRDLKPANIMLEPSPGPIERVVLIDFGFATFEGSAKLTLQGTVVGSLTYIAPERLRAENPDHRSDIYALAVVLFELLTGRPPFEAEDDYDLISMHLNDDPPSVTTIAPSAGALDPIIARALAKAPADRYADAQQMADAIEAAAAQLTE
jgi:eukaryotic-like serine/threonine-protein kinase